MKKNTKAVIEIAENFLKKQQYDAAHDLNHHKSVWRTAQDIAKNVERVDFPAGLDLLEISCMWHDVLTKPYPPEIRKEHKKVTAETADYVKHLMLKNGFEENEAQTVYLAVLYHEFDDRPQNREGEILFDADKLDVLSIERVRRFVQSDEAEKYRHGNSSQQL
jgi:HD superfamily phosphodiesterase